MRSVSLRLRQGLFAALLTPALASSQAGPSADDLFGRGVQLHQAGDTLGAIEWYLEALEKDPGRLDARSNLGAAYASLGRHDEAIRHYDLALAAMPPGFPGAPQIRFNLGLAYYKAWQVTEASAELQQVVDAEPGHRNARLLLADCRLRQGDPDAVVALLAGRDAEFGDDRLFAFLLGSALLERGETVRGQKYIDRLFRAGESAEGHLLLGTALIARGEFLEAIPELEKAAALNPKLPTVHSLLGRAYMNAGRREESNAAFEKELQNDPNDFAANLYLGLHLKDDNKMAEAYAHLQRAGRVRPADASVLYGMGALHLAEGRIDEAQQALEELTRKVPDYRQGHVLLATVYYRQKNRELGDRHREIAQRLREEEQARSPGEGPPGGGSQ